MPRKPIPREDKRQTVAFTLPGREIARLDKYVDRVSLEIPHAIIKRQTILERLLIDFLNEVEKPLK